VAPSSDPRQILALVYQLPTFPTARLLCFGFGYVIGFVFV